MPASRRTVSPPAGYSLKATEHLDSYGGGRPGRAGSWGDLNLEGERRLQIEHSLQRLETLRKRRVRQVKAMPVEIVRAWFEADLALTGNTLDEVIATVRRGRLARERVPMHDALCRAVARLRERGVTLDKIGIVLGKGKRSVLNLQARGIELIAADADASTPAPARPMTPCRKHVEHLDDCPACLRANAWEIVGQRGVRPATRSRATTTSRASLSGSQSGAVG